MDIILCGKRIGQDSDGYLSLTDMWRIAGEDNAKRPAQWQKLPTTRELVEALCQNVGFSHIIAKTQTKSALYAKSGKGGGTFAHHILALAYAEYLNPEIGVEVRDIALRYWAKDITLLDDFLREQKSQANEDRRRLFFQHEIGERNQNVNVELRKTGTPTPQRLQDFHDAGYRGLYDGRDEADIHELKELKKNERILDHMTSAEGAANWFRITQAEQRIKNARYLTLEEACSIHHDTGERIRTIIDDMGGPMPEDMPVADHVRYARKRLKDYHRGLK